MVVHPDTLLSVYSKSNYLTKYSKGAANSSTCKQAFICVLRVGLYVPADDLCEIAQSLVHYFSLSFSLFFLTGDSN